MNTWGFKTVLDDIFTSDSLESAIETKKYFEKNGVICSMIIYRTTYEELLVELKG